MSVETQHPTHAVDGISLEHFLRSINLLYDAEAPERIAHYQPTSKSVSLVQALLGHDSDRAFFVVAPYGSGKSLTATYVLHQIENRRSSQDMLGRVARRLSPINRALGDFSQDRVGSRTAGVVIALHGFADSLHHSLQTAAVESLQRIGLAEIAAQIGDRKCTTIEDSIELLLVLKEQATRKRFDRIAIIWDEFGRHLENLMAEGRANELSDIQLLAEFCGRTKVVPVTLGLILHQSLLHYAGNVTQAVRKEWKKVEGRFRTIQYVDDSKEVYRLIAQVVDSLPGKRPLAAKAAAFWAKAALAQGFFKGFDESELADLFQAAYPLHPVVLYLLPRVSGRVAQNERTLFSFLRECQMSGTLHPDRLYDYFSTEMRSDTAAGGTYRNWVQTESALSRVDADEQAARLLKTTCLLGLGISGEHNRALRGQLEFSYRVFRRNADEVSRKIDMLIKSKLLLHRKYSGEISVWHGADADLRARLEEEKRQLRPGFDLVEFLHQDSAPPVWLPIQHNSDNHVCRYFECRFSSLSELQRSVGLTDPMPDLRSDCDGRIIYIVAESAAEVQDAKQYASSRFDHERVLLVLPGQALRLTETALEVRALQHMQHDSNLLDSDPMILPEIRQMIDDARRHLQNLLGRLVYPRNDGPQFFYRKQPLEVRSAQHLRKKLSGICDGVYSCTPRINNERIVRKKVASSVVNARKKLLLGILERSGQDNLGFEGYSPYVSMLRTVLLSTGIYREEVGGQWGYAEPAQLEDPGMRAVWGLFEEFFTRPTPIPEPPSRLFDELVKPPYGLRAGVIPILFSAALRAFPNAISITREGHYLTDILPSDVEQLCREPNKFRVDVLDLHEESLAYLSAFTELFSAESTAQGQSRRELVRACFDALEVWKSELSPAALTSREVSDPARKFQTLLARTNEPVRLLLVDIPGQFGVGLSEYKKLIKLLGHVKGELEGVVRLFLTHATESFVRVLDGNGSIANGSIREVGRNWADCFPESVRSHLSVGAAKALLETLHRDYDSDDKLLNGLAHLLVGRDISRWTDYTVAQFEREFGQAVHHIEETALNIGPDQLDGSAAISGLETLIARRIGDYFGKLQELVGRERAEEIVDRVSRRPRK